MIIPSISHKNKENSKKHSITILVMNKWTEMYSIYFSYSIPLFLFYSFLFQLFYFIFTNYIVQHTFKKKSSEYF